MGEHLGSTLKRNAWSGGDVAGWQVAFAQCLWRGGQLEPPLAKIYFKL